MQSTYRMYEDQSSECRCSLFFHVPFIDESIYLLSELHLSQKWNQYEACLDGLAGGLSICAFAAFGLMAWNTTWCEGYQELAIFAFLLIGSLGGFLLFNAHPAKVFMGDTGSLALGGALATLAILTRHEFSLIMVGGVFVIETLTSLIQIIAIRKFHKKVFLKAPIHHHFEELGWSEVDIVRLFWAVCPSHREVPPKETQSQISCTTITAIYEIEDDCDQNL